MKRITLACLAAALLLSACEQHLVQPEDQHPGAGDVSASLRVEPPTLQSSMAKSGNVDEADRTAAAQAYLQAVNEDLAAQGLAIRVSSAEWVGGGEAGEAGQTVYANDRQLRLSAQWVPGDARRGADGDNITFVNDRSFMFANAYNLLPNIDAEPSIDASFATWEEDACSKLNLVKRADPGNLNYSILLSTGEPTDFFYADISTFGFIPGSLFDIFLGPGASTSVLGVTFTFIFGTNTPDGFVPSDINSDGYADVALKEIWYNDSFGWSTNGSAIDIETVALHENGHALGLGHFGRVSVTEKNNKLHVSPRAVMNAFILGTLRDLLGTDNASYCSLYASWPS